MFSLHGKMYLEQRTNLQAVSEWGSSPMVQFPEVLLVLLLVFFFFLLPIVIFKSRDLLKALYVWFVWWLISRSSHDIVGGFMGGTGRRRSSDRHFYLFVCLFGTIDELASETSLYSAFLYFAGSWRMNFSSLETWIFQQYFLFAHISSFLQSLSHVSLSLQNLSAVHRTVGPHEIELYALYP